MEMCCTVKACIFVSYKVGETNIIDNSVCVSEMYIIL